MRPVITVVLSLILLCVAAPAVADPPAQPPQVNQFDIILFGRVWNVVSYFVQDDLLDNPNEDTFLEPEGLAFKSGILYASGDREPEETDSRLAIYDYPPTGPLSFNSFIQMPNSESNWWGPEGLTFNDSGSGYGSGSNQLVSIEYDDPNQVGIVDLTSGTILNRLVIEKAEDITFLPNRSEFATLTVGANSIDLTYYIESMVSTDESLEVVPGSCGLEAVNTSFGSWFTQTNQADEILILVTKANPGNAVLAYDLNGNQIGRQYDLPVEPKARIPLGGGFYLLKPAFAAAEAVTVDQNNKVLFVGDEDNSMIHVLTPVRLAADFDADEDVDASDLGMFASHWLDTDCAEPDWCAGTDLDRDTSVNFIDYALFAEQWSATGNY